jgi:hypothetical protein
MSLPEWLYLLLIFSLPIARPPVAEISRFAVPATDLIFLCAAAACGLAVVGGRRSVVWDPIYWLLAFYVAALAVSTLVSDHPQASMVKAAGTAYLAGLSVLTVQIVRSWDVLKRVMTAWVAGTSVTVVAGVLAVVFFYAGWRDLAAAFGLTSYGSLPAGNYPRVAALFVNMNMLCNYLIPSLMIVQTMRALGWLGAAWPRILVPGIWFTAVFTVSSGIGGLLLAATEWTRLREPPERRTTTSRLLCAAGILVALALLPATMVLPAPREGDTRSAGPLPFDGLQAAPRVFVWRGAFDTFLDHPVIGQGLATPAASYQFVTLTGEHQHLTDAHNVWLNLAAQGGLLTLAAFAAICVSLVRRCRGVWGGREPMAVVQTGLGLSLVGAVAYHGLSGSFEDARHLWIVAGLVVAVSRGLEPAAGAVLPGRVTP